jgi:hypothetical protein
MLRRAQTHHPVFVVQHLHGIVRQHALGHDAPHFHVLILRHAPQRERRQSARHHFATEEAISALRELNRVARRRVIVSDLRRSWVAAGGLWLVSFPLGFHRVSRHDGVVSILRGFDVTELSALVTDAVGVTPVVRKRAGWRVTASWAPA